MTHSFPTRRSSDLDDCCLSGESQVHDIPISSRSFLIQFGADGALLARRRASLRSSSFSETPAATRSHSASPGSSRSRNFLILPEGVVGKLFHTRSEEHTSELQSLVRTSYPDS